MGDGLVVPRRVDERAGEVEVHLRVLGEARRGDPVRREVQAEYEEEEPSRSWKLVTSQPGAAGEGYAKHTKAEKRVLAFD